MRGPGPRPNRLRKAIIMNSPEKGCKELMLQREEKAVTAVRITTAPLAGPRADRVIGDYDNMAYLDMHEELVKRLRCPCGICTKQRQYLEVADCLLEIWFCNSAVFER
jgi:hypothetical protein